MKKTRAQIVLALILPLLGLCQAQGASAALAACGDTPIRLAFYEYGALYFSQNKRPQGIDHDIVAALRQRSGCRFDTQVMARARIWADLASGDLDMSVSGIQTAERDAFAWFAPYLAMKNYTLIHANTAKTVRNGKDFLNAPELKFGAVRGFRHGEAQDKLLDQLRAQQRVEESADVDALFQKLRDRRIDAMYSQPPVYRKHSAELGLDKNILIQDWAPSEKGLPHGLILAKSRFSPKEADYWRGLIQQMRADGTLQRIYHRYLPAQEAERLLNF